MSSTWLSTWSNPTATDYMERCYPFIDFASCTQAGPSYSPGSPQAGRWDFRAFLGYMYC